MAFGEITLIPGVNSVKTPTLNQAGVSSCNLIRYMQGLIQKIGGWVRYYPFTVGSIPRELHAWEDLGTTNHLAVGATASLSVITSGALSDITPQTTTTNTAPNFSTTNNSPTIQIVDSNIASPTTNNSVFIATPVSVAGLILQGLYPITANINTTTYQITALASANATAANTAITNITQANPAVVTASGHNLTNGNTIAISGVTGMTQVNNLNFLVAGVSGTTFQLSGVDSSAYTAYVSGGTVSPATVPMFTTTSGSSTVTVNQAKHGLVQGNNVSFLVSTTVGGIAIFGSYVVQTVVDTNNYNISVATQATSSASAQENSGNVQFIYYIAIGPQAAAQPYGSGPYGNTGAYGIGASAPAGQGTPITALDWTSANWGQTLLACPQNGGIYQWTPGSGFQTAQLVPNAPIVNGGIILAMPYQILIAYAASFTGSTRPLTVAWSSSGDYTVWTPTTTNQAGSYQIPSGSMIVGAYQAGLQGLIWTDIELWSMIYVGLPFVFSFNKIMTGCGLIGSHAMGMLNNTVFWMSQRQFFVKPPGGAPQVLPCTVWDYIFQNLDTTNAYKIRCAINSTFSEVTWHFPSLSGGTGENDSYVKYNAAEGEWDYGQYPVTGRSAWIDQSVLGTPIGGGVNGLIYQHEQGYDGDGQAINPTFTTGYAVVGDGENFSFVDQLIPDFKYGTQPTLTGATIQLQLNSVNYPSETPTTAGPYSVTASSNYVSTRLRGRQVSLSVSSGDAGSFWRIGKTRYRWAADGRR